MLSTLLSLGVTAAVALGTVADAVTPNSAMVAAADSGESMWLQYQREIIADKSPIVGVEKGRRTGVTFCTSYKTTMGYLAEDDFRDTWYMSANEDEAKSYIAYCAQWVDFSKGAYGAVVKAEKETVEIDGYTYNTYTLTFPAVSTPTGQTRTPKVTALSSNHKVLRGKGGHFVWDEAAHHSCPAEVWKAAAALTQWGGQIIVISTHNGERAWFNTEICAHGRRRRENAARENDMPVSLHTISIYKAVEQGLVEKINRQGGTNWTRDAWLKAERAKYATQDAWDEEAGCIPSGNIDSYFPHELTRPLVDEGAPLTQQSLLNFLRDIRKECERFNGEITSIAAGCDIGRFSDRFVIWVFLRTGGRWRLGGVLEYQDQKWSSMLEACTAVMLMEIPSKHAGGCKCGRMCIDDTGLGNMLAETMKDKFRSRIEQITFTSDNKEHLATQLRTVVEDRTITLHDDAVTLQQFANTRKTKTATNRDRFDAEADETGHLDRMWACALATEAGSKHTRKRKGSVGTAGCVV